VSLRLRRANAAIVYLLFVSADGFIRGLLYTVLAVYFVLRVGMDPFQLVLIGTVLEASCFIFEIPTGVVADVYSRRLSIIIGQALFGLAYVVQASVPLFVPIALAEIVRAIGETFLSGAVQAWVGGELEPERLPRLLVRGVQLRRVGRLLGIGASGAAGQHRSSAAVGVRRDLRAGYRRGRWRWPCPNEASSAPRLAAACSRPRVRASA
jgi:MFS transporter, DHA3 family, tetracycline resistance protein